VTLRSRWCSDESLNDIVHRVDFNAMIPLLALQLFHLAGQVLVCRENLTEFNEGPDDHDVHLYGSLAFEHRGQHGHTVFRERVGFVLGVSAATFF
jgi:hypothetical protein